ncbi:MAG TPA: hypothetical protein VFN38_17975 [Gemmatimonadaceae bacterium]|nr:hypothetical protein [Gemmatimonadaceae bacterium]
MRILNWSLAFAALPAVLSAQAAHHPAEPQSAAAPSAPLTEAQQIASALLPLPAEFRADARVLGYRAGTKGLVTLRDARGAFVCLASDPAMPRFHVACYHRSLEPFMARGRALRAAGVKGDQVDSARFREIRRGTLAMPKQPAALYSLSGPPGSYDAAANTASGARALSVIYISGATTASTGLSATPTEGAPWLMFPGTPKAHIMLVPKM